MIGYLIELDAKVPLKELVDKGLLDWTVIRDRDIYLHYDCVINSGTGIMQAYTETSIEWRLSTRVIMRIVNRMKDAGNGNTH